MSTGTLDSIISYLGNFHVQTGVILAYVGDSAPSGYLFCRGQAVSRTSYAKLFSVIGTTYGAGDGSTTFNLPNLKGKVVIGVSSSHALGTSGGEKTHTIQTTELPSHVHSSTVSFYIRGTDYSNWNFISGGTYSGTTATVTAYTGSSTYDSIDQVNTNAKGNIMTLKQTTGSKGSGTAANNMQPYVAINYIIKV